MTTDDAELLPPVALERRAGHDVAVRRWEPSTPRTGTVVLVHGLAEHSGRYGAVGTQLAGAGLAVAALDLPGFGRSGGRRGDVASMADWLDVVATLVEDADRPTHLLGHSMGGLVALAYVLSEDGARPVPDRVVVSAPALDANVPGWQRGAARVLGRVVPTVRMSNPITGDQLSRDPEVGRRYFADPLLQAATTVRLGSVLLTTMDEVRRSAHRLEVPTLVVHGADDELVPASVSEVLEAAPAVDRRVLAGLRHEAFNEPEGPEVVDAVIGWLLDRV